MGELRSAWERHRVAFGLDKGWTKGALKVAVVLREPAERIYSTYMHGKQFDLRAQVTFDLIRDEFFESNREEQNFTLLVIYE